MKCSFSALTVLAAIALPAHAHFIWVVPQKIVDDESTALVVFSDSLHPDKAELLDKIKDITFHERDQNGKTTNLKWAKTQNGFYIALPGSEGHLVGAVCRYGIVQRGQSKPFLLNYYAKGVAGDP